MVWCLLVTLAAVLQAVLMAGLSNLLWAMLCNPSLHSVRKILMLPQGKARQRSHCRAGLSSGVQPA